MEHTKGNLSVGERDGYSNLLVDGRIFDGITQIGQVKSINHKADALRLVTCWNAHDTLTAKAGLLDEAISLLNDILEWDGILDHSKVRIKQTTDKAKELNNG